MKKSLLIVLIAFGAPAWSQIEIVEKQCKELTEEVTLLILGDAPLELIYDAVKNREENLLKKANKNNKYAKFVASTVYRWIGAEKPRNPYPSYFIAQVTKEVCDATNLKSHYRF